MPGRISLLTPDQERLLNEWIEEWSQIGICAERPSVVRVERLYEDSSWQRLRLHCENDPDL